MTNLTNMKFLRILPQFAAIMLFPLLAVNAAWGSETVANSSSATTLPHRLTVQDFMGTWKVFAKNGEDPIPSQEPMDRAMIGKTIIFSPKRVIDNTYPYLVMSRKVTNNPVYKIKYKELFPDTPYPNIDPPPFQYETPQPYSFTYFEVGYFDKKEKKIIYTRFYVGSNDKSLPFALTLDGDPVFYLCKLNPKTGKCQDHP